MATVTGTRGITTDLETAAQRLREGGLVAFPTETVYGLGADATNDQAVAQIYAAKGRPSFNPLIVHVADLAHAERCVTLSDTARTLAARFWPGPLTMVLPRRPECPISLLVSAGLPTIGVRVPAHPVAKRLIELSGCFVAAPSANRSGKISPTTAAHVVESLGEGKALVLDGGACAVGVESTIVDLSGEVPVLLRPGGVPLEDIEALIGPVLRGGHTGPSNAEAGQPFTSPGQMLSHYAPSLPVRLNATSVLPTEALLAFGSDCPSGAALTLQLSATGDATEAAANLFRLLHEADARRFECALTGIAVVHIPDTGLGLAMNDRLQRAAADRPPESQ